LKIKVENVLCTLTPDNSKDIREIQRQSNFMSAEAPGHEYTWKFKNTDWDGQVCLLKAYRGYYTIPTGFLPTVAKRLQHYRVGITYEDCRGIPDDLELQSTTLRLRDYQWECCAAFAQNATPAFAWWPRGLLRMATGSGKTELAVALVQMFNVPTVFLVHRKTLLYQAKERFEKYNVPVGMLGDGKNKLQIGGVNIIMAQSLHNSIKKDKLKELVDSTKFIIIDEAHGIASNVEKGNQITEVLDSFKNAYIRLGLTATPFLRAKYDNFLLEGYTGQVISDIGTRFLIDAGYLQDAKIFMYEIPPLSAAMLKMPKGTKKSKWQHIYELAVIVNNVRNSKIIEVMQEYPGPTLILVKSTMHGDCLVARAEAKGLDLPFISGKDSEKVRKAAVDRMVKTKGLLLATGIFDEGVDIPEIQTLIKAAGYKSEGRNIQQLGRGLRKSEGKTDLNVIDFLDRTAMLAKHSADRRKSYQQIDRGLFGFYIDVSTYSY